MGRPAAFFDVDRTLLAGASGLHLARPFRKQGLLSARQLARTMLIQLSFSSKGSNHDQLDRFTEGVRELMRGWDRDLVVQTVEQELEQRLKPVVYQEALDRIAQHKAQGHAVYAVSATMEEIIEPLAELLGLDGAVASHMEVVDGKFTGEILKPNHGDAKADRLREFAAEHDLDLAASSAYSDSITDAEFLRAVGRAYAVNPDKGLRELAEEEGWGILRFTTTVRAPLHRRCATRLGFVALAGGLALRAARRRRQRAIR
ncbi:MAG: HAD-IB family hydrolase [Thermoleophilia bacterium]|nr:HAD-IB family hydrolase [Thermoleophilia bacterium]